MERETISADVSVQRSPLGYEIMVDDRRVGPFTDRTVAMVWANVMAARRGSLRERARLGGSARRPGEP